MNIREIVELAGLQKHLAEVHTFGLGELASPGLIIELAEITGGTFNFILEHEKTLNSKIVTALQQASRPNLIRTRVSQPLMIHDSVVACVRHRQPLLLDPKPGPGFHSEDELSLLLFRCLTQILQP